MSLLAMIPLFIGAVMVGSALVYLIFRLGSKAYFRSKKEYDKESEP